MVFPFSRLSIHIYVPIWTLSTSTLWIGCGGRDTETALSTDTVNNTSTDTDDTTSTEPIDELEAVQVFRVPERPWDLSVDENGLLYCSAQGGNKVYTWDPVTETREELRTSLPDVQNIHVTSDGTLYFTRTDYGQSGGLSKVSGNTTEALFTKADSGTPMQWPMDFVETPNSINGSEWVIADYQAHLLFVVHANQSVTTRSAGSSKPQNLLFVENTLYVGGEDGIYSIDWPDGEPIKIDDRKGFGLELVGDEIWAGNATHGIFVVGGSSVGLSHAARPGSLLWTQEGLYFADHIGEGVWLHTP